MPQHDQNQADEGLRIYDELIAVHTIMRRSTILTADALRRFAAGPSSNAKALVALIRWQAEFVHHHHRSEDELFWPVLRELFPDAIASLDELTEQHHVLDAELDNLSSAANNLANATSSAVSSAMSSAVSSALSSADTVRDVLISHLDTEEPVLLKLFPQTPAPRIVELRKAIVAGAPRSGPDLVLGLLEDPEPAQGTAIMHANFPPPVRLLRPLLLRRYRARKRQLVG